MSKNQVCSEPNGSSFRAYASVLVRLLVAILIVSSELTHCLANPIDPIEVRILDGDTIQVAGITYRMIGYDTPEIASRWRKVGPGEKALAIVAKERFQELINSGPLDLQPTPCACSASKIARGACNFGRKCAVLNLNGKNIGESLISEGLAVRFVCTSTKCPKMPDWPSMMDSSPK